MRIIDILVCPVASADICGFLKVLITEHHDQFVTLYTEDAMIPKFHYLLHYPEQILQIGPMLRSWTMRHEAKLNIFKRASRIGNFKNIALSLASRHQRLLCYELSTGKLLQSPIECGPCPDPSLLGGEPEHLQESLRTAIPGLSNEIFLTRPTWVKKSELTYKQSNCYVIIGSDELNSTFGRVDVLGGDLCILLVTLCIVDYFDDHFHAYVIHPSPNQSYICTDALREPCILHVHRRTGNLYIYLKHYFCV